MYGDFFSLYKDNTGYLKNSEIKKLHPYCSLIQGQLEVKINQMGISSDSPCVQWIVSFVCLGFFPCKICFSRISVMATLDFNMQKMFIFFQNIKIALRICFGKKKTKQ